MTKLSGLLALPLAAAAGAVIAQEPATPSDIDLTAASFSLEGTRAHFDGLRLTQGDVTVEADAATASKYDFEQSEWTLTGNVSMSVGTARIEGTSATFTFEDNQLRRFELLGEPATFEAADIAEGRGARGGADRLAYDEGEAQLSLVGDAWLSVGANEVVGCDLVYDLDATGDERIFWSGTTDCGERFRIQVVPRQGNGAADAPAPR